LFGGVLSNSTEGETLTENITKSQERAQRWLKKNTKRFAFKKLEREIVKTGVCTECGACVSNCPVNALTGDLASGKYVPTLTGDCTACGICYAICPRTYVLWSELIGDFRSVWKVKALADVGKKQNGGAATAFLYHLLNEGIVDAAIVAKKDSSAPWMPEAAIVKNADEITQYSGTVYAHVPVVDGVVKALKDGLSTLAVVGTSCNIDAINNMQKHPAGFFNMDMRSEIFKVGLFCMEAFEYPKLVAFLSENGVDIKDVEKMEISSGKFRVTIKGEDTEWAIKDLDVAAASSCSYCHDLTCKTSDISCGNIGSEDDQSTVIIRTVRGEHIFQEALAAELIEAEMMEPKELRMIMNTARMKATKYYKLKSAH
jgi:coenzyme F420 hydrogenase subunit beta